jgi:hypothetical protein
VVGKIISEAPIRSAEELIDALAARKDALGFSNALLEEVGGFATGHIDKILGPTRLKKPSLSVLDALADMLAVSFVMVHDEEKKKRMATRWEERRQDQVRNNGRVSQVAIRRARPFVLAENARKGGLKRWAGSTPEERTAAARKAAAARWGSPA